jgi:hypothetical protein
VGVAMAEHKTNQEVIRIRSSLTELEAEQASLEARLADLLQPSPPPIITEAAPVAANTLTAASSAAEKIALFRSLFAGRTDVFPVRWENSKKGRSGYALRQRMGQGNLWETAGEVRRMSKSGIHPRVGQYDCEPFAR